MRHAKWAGVLMALITTGIWAQQAAAASDTATYKPPQSSINEPVKSCPASFDFHPEVDGVYSLTSDIKAPKLKHWVPAELSSEAKTRGAFNPFKAPPSTLSFIVDAQGATHEVCILNPAGYGLDDQAAKAVRQYRFSPAIKNGAAVAVRVSMQVAFNLNP
jgi:TonB family protein